MTAPFDDDCVPRLRPGVRLKHDTARGQWLLLAPERVVMPDETALAVLQRVDGTRSLADIVGELAAEYDAPVDVIRKDVGELLADLIDRKVVTT